MAPTPSSSSKLNQTHIFKTPQSKHRLTFNSARTPIPHPHPHPSPNVNATLKEPTTQGDHPIEVVGRIRDYPEKREKPTSSILQVNPDNQTLRIRADIGYRDFSLDGISFSEEEDLDSFYKKFVQSRINGVKLGNKCTIMMYGPTGSGKSHTMFGCSKQPGIVYKSLKDILGDGEDGSDGERLGMSTAFVQVTVLEIYNEEIYDLLSSNGGGGGFGIGWPKGGSASKVRLEVMGKKAKNATYISGTEAGKISKEIQKVEKRRIVKSTLCNDRSSRSHCMLRRKNDIAFINLQQQTAKINQGNIALKRVVESIANGDSHVPFRDSKLTMLLQDSFEDDKTKILMILCASPDPKEIHKTICTLEYGAKAKCIVRGPHTPTKDKVGTDDSSAVILGSKIAAMDQFIYKLQMENKLREKERNEAHKQLKKKEEEVAALRALIEGKGSVASEEEINLKVNERTRLLKVALEKKLEECQKMAEEFVELERRRMEEKILQQQQEVEMLRRRLEEIESELCRSRDDGSKDIDGSSFARRLLGVCADDGADMVKSMDLDMGDQESSILYGNQTLSSYPHSNNLNQVIDHNSFTTTYSGKVCLSTVFEEEEVEDEEHKEKVEDEVEEKEVIEVKRIVGGSGSGITIDTDAASSPQKYEASSRNVEEFDNADASSSRLVRIQNIFTLCGNYRELSQHSNTRVPATKMFEDTNPQSSLLMTPGEDCAIRNSGKENSPIQKNLYDIMTLASKENHNPSKESNDGQIDVHVKWEASKGNNGKFITTLKVVKDATLADLRKLIEIYLAAENQPFSFIVLGDPTGAPVPKEKESTLHAIKLPICNNQSHGYLACLRPANHLPLSPVPATPLESKLLPVTPLENKMPLASLENKLPLTPSSCSPVQCDGLSPKLAQHLNSTPFITLRRY
ncbi:Kinesin heavy chain, putative [Ricinus communis]|uniref:Kinesin heavy chain, putative n=1 Tax=Ricinus communis TaxID=3988 RepID=B9SS57_RICCO|nr:Kinesin heavy chain, putative [Ricinus communis]